MGSGKIREINKKRDHQYNKLYQQIKHLEDKQDALEERFSRREGGAQSQFESLAQEIQQNNEKIKKLFEECGANNTLAHPDTQETLELKSQINMHDKTIKENSLAIESAEEKLKEVNASITEQSNRLQKLREKRRPILE